jgi:hypothetical protein
VTIQNKGGYRQGEIFMTQMASRRELQDLISVGPAILRDFQMLGVKTVAQISRREPREMYEQLCSLTGQRQDPCVLDTFTAAVAQARDPGLPPAQCQWWFWSRERKRQETARRRAEKGKRAQK